MPQILLVIQGDTTDELDLDKRFRGATLSTAVVHISLKQLTKSLEIESKSKDSPDSTNNAENLQVLVSLKMHE